MLHLYVVDRSAESRNRVVDRIHSYLESAIKDIEVMPRVQVKPLSLEEVRFHGAPDICVLGPGVADQEITDIAKLKKIYPNSAFLVCTTSRLENLSSIEQIARQGADDTLSERTSAAEFLQKIVLLAKRVSSHASGTLVVVDSGKGGVGVTSTVAALGECLAREGKRTLLVDFDGESQDLTRFLQVRPFVNENLQFLLDGSRPITAEFVDQCVTQVWEDEENLFCLSPIPDREAFYNPASSVIRSFISVFQFLDEAFDCILIDLAGVRGPLEKAIHRLADTHLFVLSNDPAALYASAARMKSLQESLAHGGELIVADVTAPLALSRSLLRDEFCRAARIEPERFIRDSIPYSKDVRRWPGSGASPFTLGKSDFSSSIESLAVKLFPEIAPSERKLPDVYGVVTKFAAKLKASRLQVQKSEKAEQLLTGKARLTLPTPTTETSEDSAPLYVSQSQEKPEGKVVNAETDPTAEKQKDRDFDDLISGASLH
ncbi:MAG: ParA family protein [Bdellovibrionales bacterium]|nr:ParA family protein [Bdellovibrionales bacterium]